MKKFEEYSLENQQRLDDLPELQGKLLGCWCAPELCHGHILSRLVAERVGSDGNAEEHHVSKKHTMMHQEEQMSEGDQPAEPGEISHKKAKTKSHQRKAANKHNKRSDEQKKARKSEV